ncbi:MAG: Do family serine endopeptidase [Pseudomonadota bacterium]
MKRWLVLFCVSWIGVASAKLPQFTDLVKEVSPAVVNISAERTRQSDRWADQLQDRELPDFFRRFMDPESPRFRPPAMGSGFIISKDGYVLTNHHVVADADEITVSLSDRRQRTATLVGADPLSDLALLKIDANDLPTVKLGRSAALQVGEWVVAIGSPFGFEYSVTAGIVSALGRSLPENSANYIPFIQTDVAINPGNSGGPLFNMDGEVIGINSQIFTRSGGFMGLSFSIPVDIALDVVEQLKTEGKVTRGWLGVLIQPIDKDLAASFGMDRATGALVAEIASDGPAAAAGIREGDIIVEFDGREIDLSSQLPHFVGQTRVGEKVDVVVVRDTRRERLKVTIGTLDDRLLGVNRPSGQKSDASLGLGVRDLTDDERVQLNVDNGVLVIRSVGTAAQSGIQRGDVITSMGGEQIQSADNFGAQLAALEPGDRVHIRVLRNGRPSFKVLKVD